MAAPRSGQSTTLRSSGGRWPIKKLKEERMEFSFNVKIILAMLCIGMLVAIVIFAKRSRKNIATRSFSNNSSELFSLSEIILAKEFGDTLEIEIAELVASGHSQDNIAQIATELAAAKVMVKHGVTKEVMIRSIERYAREQKFKNA
jgi:hypothetical protein